MATKVNKVKYRLRGHEKFLLREGWFSKGILEVNNDTKQVDYMINKSENEVEYSKIFLNDNATDILGVGSNMVKSIRYWIKALNVVDEKIAAGYRLNQLGELICKYDPYIQQYFTLWLLHSNIVKNIEVATSFSLFFNKCDIDEFTKDEISLIMQKEMKKYIGEEFSEKSLKEDIDVILAMYSREKEEDYDPEDKLVSPFSLLGILSKVGDKYYRKQPDLVRFHEMVILYELACLFDDDKNQIGIESLVEDDYSIGKIYNMSRVSINNYLDKLESLGYIKVIRTAGLDVVEKVEKFNKISVIKEYFEKYGDK